jgi:uncharacterized membrane protein
LIYFAALLIGVVAGMRALTAPAAVCWAARLGWLNLAGTPLAWLGGSVAPWVFALAAIGELVNDKLPKTPSRKIPPAFLARVFTGGLSGAAIGASGGALPVGLLLGVVGAVAGTIGGYELRSRLSRAMGKDFPAALIEDVIAIALAILAVRLA